MEGKEANVLDLLLGASIRKPPTKKIKLKRLSADIGSDIIFTLTALPYHIVEMIRGKSEDWNVHTVLEGTSEPDLRCGALMEKYGAPTPVEMLKKMLLPGEIEDISRVIEKLSGFRTTTIQEIKKK